MAEKKAVRKEVDVWKALLYPHLAEKSMGMIESQNKLVFIVNRKSNKRQIKAAIEQGFDVKVLAVNTEITRKCQKKAYVRLAPEFAAADVASKLGMM